MHTIELDSRQNNASLNIRATCDYINTETVFLSKCFNVGQKEKERLIHYTLYNLLHMKESICDSTYNCIYFTSNDTELGTNERKKCRDDEKIITPFFKVSIFKRNQY